MDHAFECVALCPSCDGTGEVKGPKKGRKRTTRPCKQCQGSGDCGMEWRGENPPNCCPSCGGVYLEWLSFEVEPEDVWLNREWDHVRYPKHPKRPGFPLGSYRVRP